MNNNYFIAVNYHYIGSETEFKSGIFPTSSVRLAKQIDLIKKDFELINEEELVEFLHGKRKFDKKPGCILTFDDGLKCQYKNALPVLKKKRAPAVFFVSSSPLTLNKVCLVHKVHCLLSEISPRKLLNEIKLSYKAENGNDLIISQALFKKAIKRKFYDDEKTAILKYLINNYLTSNISEKIIHDIFIRTFGNEKRFAKKFYSSKEELRLVKKLYPQFSLGLHSADHIDIPTNTKKKIEEDVLENYNFLKKEIGAPSIFGFSYPFGAINAEDLKHKLNKIINRLNLQYAFTTYKGRNNLSDNRFLLKRFDTNDAPGGKNPIGEI